MILSTSQPYWCPYPGYFYKIALSDVCVLLDQVQFPRGMTWINRNRFKNDQGTLWLTIPVWKKGLGLQQIDRVRICHEGRWATKHLKSLMTAYAHAPYIGQHADFLEKLFLAKMPYLVQLNIDTIHYLAAQLQIKTQIRLQSELQVTTQGHQLLIDLCNKTGAAHYLAQRQAHKYLDPRIFEDAGVELTLFNPPTLIYPQLWGPFIANLSVFDLFLNCGLQSVRIFWQAAAALGA